ncbi:hypothetical protein ACH5RR_006683 [Cinchona calisaya]|uniref:Uncharacterized protein n=1 Tax=Cinchona calisaya TaxID=153742 RepID=A0ABD3APN6_9GENT
MVEVFVDHDYRESIETFLIPNQTLFLILYEDVKERGELVVTQRKHKVLNNNVRIVSRNLAVKMPKSKNTILPRQILGILRDSMEEDWIKS